MTPSLDFAKAYREVKNRILVPPSFEDNCTNSAYKPQGRMKDHTAKDIQEWTAVYYSLVEEVDIWVGHLLDRLKSEELYNHTLVVFTSDHGEM